MRTYSSALREMRRMLREGGCLLLMDFAADGMSFNEIMAIAKRYQRAFGPVEDRKQPVSFDQLAEEIEMSGFEILNQERLCSPTGGRSSSEGAAEGDGLRAEL